MSHTWVILNIVLYPQHTFDRIQNVEVDLDRAEIGLKKTEIDSVDLSANSIVTARNGI